VRITRTLQNDRATLGQLRLDPPGSPILWTLEDPLGKDKGPVPAGRYPIVLRWSNRFQMLVPGIEQVPGFTDIEIHAGNTAVDTKACVLVGMYRVSDSEIADSRTALGKILQLWRSWESQVVEITEEF
jgi:hypothetical protein